MAKLNNQIFEGAAVMFRNFGGRAGPYNAEGVRSFCLFLDHEKAVEMEKEGWNVKRLKPRIDAEEGDPPQAYINVAVEFGKGRPPRIVLLTNRGTKRIELDVEAIRELDYADVSNWDIILNPFEWEVNGNSGIKAYLKSAFITLNEDELELKYAHIGDGQDPTMDLSSTANDEEKELVDA